MEKIGTQHGFEASRLRIKEWHAGEDGTQDGGAIDRTFNSLQKMRVNQNELIDRMTAHEARLDEIERRLGERPF